MTRIFEYDPNCEAGKISQIFESIGLRLDKRPGPWPQLIDNGKIVGWLPRRGKIEIEKSYLELNPGTEETIRKLLKKPFINQDDFSWKCGEETLSFGDDEKLLPSYEEIDELFI